MGLDTNFNISPYYDDFDENKNFHRILFKPGYAVQARELTQLQTILQNQVERFGNNILINGTIIQGCNFKEITNIGYVKLLDLNASGQPVSLSSYAGLTAQGVTTGVKAVIQSYANGLQSQSPDLNTLFVKYITTGSTGAKVFSATENINILNANGSTIDTVIAAGTVDSAAVGNSYGVVVTDGIIYQKGFFIRVDQQLAIVSKYTNVPNGLVIGFQTSEQIVTSNQDTSLLDNANGYNNYNAPGADRVKLVPTLVVYTLAQATADPTFFGIQEYELGRVVRKNVTTQYAGITTMLEQRTKEEAGNYTVNNFPLSVSNNVTGNTNLLSVLVGSGVAYVEGKRVELVNTYPVDLQKAESYNTEQNQIISTNIGNYILVDQYMGNFDFNVDSSITLYDSYQYAANSGAVPTSPTGTSIGTAKVRSVVYDSGTIGSNTATYRMYIFDVQMNSGQNFANVKSVYYNGANKGVADLISSNINDVSFKISLFPVGKTGIKSLPASNTSLSFTYRTIDSALTLNGSTGSLSITIADSWPYTGTLDTIQKQDIVLIPTANSSPYVANRPIDLSGATVSVAGSVLTITGLSTTGTNVPVIAYYNAVKTVAQPAGKQLVTSYIKLTANSSQSTYSLGLPDVYSVQGIYIGSGANNYSESNADNTANFRFDNGQRDAYYGLASITKKASLTLTTGDSILVKVLAFKKNTSGSYSDGFFTVNSYPIDDANTANTAAITTQEIPRYTSENGTVYDLRNVIDCRPYAANTATYTANVAAATVNPSSILSFGTSELFNVSPNKQIYTDYDYYLPRTDILFIDKNGNFVIQSGAPAEQPSPPSDPASGLVLATINIPVYPSLPKNLADKILRSDLGTTLTPRTNRGYTMSDIARLDRRISNIEYYAALNALETSATNMVITDANGLSRFKNGIITDNFADLTVADLSDNSYSAGIDPVNQELIPKFNSYPLSLKPTGTWSNVDQYNQVATLKATGSTLMISQTNASTLRNLSADTYNFLGTAGIYPQYDSAPDTVQAPDININVDTTQAFASYTSALAQLVPLSVSNTVTSTSTSQTSNATSVSTTTTRTSTTTTSALAISSYLTNTTNVGDFITNVTFSPYMRGRQINISAVGLRPNTRHYFFFDGVDVNAWIIPGGAPNSTNTSIKDMVPIANIGYPVYTNSNGVLNAIFLMPDNTFYVGDRVLNIYDVPAINQVQTGATSSASVTYHAFNYSTTKSNVTISTRTPEYDIATSSATSSSSSTITSQIYTYSGNQNNWSDSRTSQGGPSYSDQNSAGSVSNDTGMCSLSDNTFSL